ncbi:hypothetical protein IPH92_03835 [Candidatus Kaiserbacteria bacterium]|nr:MAG: hypothetical protein IPH92_03835 [Candidatus Kaiserbacteria bacterium]
MKKINALDLTLLAVLGFGCVTCVGITHAIADEEVPEAMPAVERVSDRAEERAEIREERHGVLESRAQDRIINLASNVTTRLTAALDRMSNIATRLETRINKLTTLGVDTGTAQSRLQEARRAIEAGNTKLKNTPSVSSAIRGDSPRESFRAIRVELVAVRDLVRESHILLIDTVTILKEAIRTHESGNEVRDAVTASTSQETAE